MRDKSISWLSEKIRELPSDTPVMRKTRGYNKYRTQKGHWLGWLNTKSRTGSYPQVGASNRNARFVYNHIMEPRMLIWLAFAAEIDAEQLEKALCAAEAEKSMAAACAAIRKEIPWEALAMALESRNG